MTRYLFDTSAIMAVINQESGSALCENYLDGAGISTVNLAEVVSKYSMTGASKEETLATVNDLVSDIIPFDALLAGLAGQMMPQTKPLGLSLDDRACLATAEHYNLEVITADKIWLKLKTPVKITLIR